MNDQEQTRDEIISAAARDAGYRVTRSQLRRWRQYGLIDRPRQRGRGRGAGSASVYPASTAKRVFAICQLLPTHRAFPELAWELWLGHEDIRGDLVVGYLRAIAKEHDEVLAKMRPLGFDRPDLTPEALELVQKVAQSRYVPAELRSRLGPDKDLQDGRVETVFRTTAQIMVGAYDANAAWVYEDEDSDGVMLARAAGLDPARSDRVLGLEPWLPRDPSDQLELTSDLIGGDWLPLVDGLTITELADARDRWQSFRKLAMSFGDAFGELFQSNLAGFPALAASLHDEDSESSALAILCMAQMMRMPRLGFLKGLEQLEDVAANWFAQGAPAMRAMQILRDEVPDFAAALSPEHLRSVIGSKEDFDANNAAMVPLAEKHEAAVLDAMRRAGSDVTSSPTASRGPALDDEQPARG